MLINRRVNRALKKAVLIILGSASTIAMAREPTTQPRSDDGTSLGDIVVTARKRAERTLDVPVAITALNSQMLERYGSSNLTDAIQRIPQVSISRVNTGSGAFMSIRGISSSFLDTGIEQAVSVNIDGVPTSRGQIVLSGFTDLDTLSVLKGPQALYFGKNSPGGVIDIVTKGPTTDVEGFARGGYEFNAREHYLEGAIGGPLTETLGIRVAIRESRMDGGYIKNTAQPLPAGPFGPTAGAGHKNYPGNREALGRLTVAFKPSSDFSATLKVMADRYRDHGDPYVPFSCNPAGYSDFGVVDPLAVCGGPKGGKTTLGRLPPEIFKGLPAGYHGGIPRNAVDTYFGSLQLNYRLDNITLSSTTGFYKYSIKKMGTADLTNFGLGAHDIPEQNRSWTQEVRAATSFDGPLNITVGGFVEDNRRSSMAAVLLLPVGPDPVTGRNDSIESTFFNSGFTSSAFGQATWKILPSLELSGGARYTHQTKRVNMGVDYIHPAFAAISLAPGDRLKGRRSESNISPEASLSWHLDHNSMLYGAYKTGFKSGGFSNSNVIPATATAENQSFDSETIRGFEIGYKASLLDGGLYLDVSAYRYAYKNLQQTAFDAATTSYFTLNAGSARIKGIEASANYKVTSSFNLRGSVARNSARFLKFAGAPCWIGQTVAEGCLGATQDLTGRKLQNAPSWTGTIGASVDAPISQAWALGLTVDGRYTSKYNITTIAVPFGEQNSFAVLDASIRLKQANGGLEFSLIGKNLTNKYYGLVGSEKPFGSRGDVYAIIGRPRQIQFEVTKRF